MGAYWDTIFEGVTKEEHDRMTANTDRPLTQDPQRPHALPFSHPDGVGVSCTTPGIETLIGT